MMGQKEITVQIFWTLLAHVTGDLEKITLVPDSVRTVDVAHPDMVRISVLGSAASADSAHRILVTGYSRLLSRA